MRPVGLASHTGPAEHHAKKKARRATEQDRPELTVERAAWRQAFAAVDPTRLVFVDESGATTAMDRTCGCSASGKRIDGPVPHGHWLVTTLTAAVRLGGVPEPDCLAFVGATDAMAFETDAEQYLAPTLRPGDIVIMDNLGPHKRPQPIAALEAVGAAVRFLPPCSPDLNPIERLYSKLKAYRRNRSRPCTRPSATPCGP